MRILLIMTLFLGSMLSIASDIEPYENLSLEDAKKIAIEQNLEINMAQFDIDVAKLGQKVAQGYDYGKLDATLMGLRSNDAGNVFGFKLQSREATFGDFGFSEFLSGVSQAISASNGDFSTFASMMQNPAVSNQLLQTAPRDLNYPGDRNHFDLTLKYVLPIYTGGKLSRYKQIASMMVDMSRYDKQKVIAQKLYSLEKVYYDISLLNTFEKELSVIKENIEQLRFTTLEMKKEGYAKRTDLLEVESKLHDVERMIFQAQANRELSYQFLNFLLNSRVASIKPPHIDTFKCDLSVDDILSNNKDIQKAELGLKIQHSMADVKQASYLPEVGAFAEYGSSDDEFLNEFIDKDRYTIGFQAKLNIFNGGIDAANIEQERLKQLKVKQQVLLAKKGIALQYKKIKTEIKNYDFQIGSLKKELELSSEIFNNYQERYKEGLASINDVVIKQSIQLEKMLELLRLKNIRADKILQIKKLAY